MSNFFKLIYNETVKTYIKKSTWVMYIILAVMIIATGALNKAFDTVDRPLTYGDDWREVLEAQNEDLLVEQAEHEQAIEEHEAEHGEDTYDSIYYDGPNMDLYEENLLFLKEDVKPSGYGAWHFVSSNAGLLSVVSLLTIIVAAGIVANEFRWGTIKLLLIRPISRLKILLSKYVSVLLFALFTLVFVFASAWLVGAVMFGVEGANPAMVTYDYDAVTFEAVPKVVSVFKEVVASYGYGLVNLVMMSTFAFMISAAFRNSSLAIGTAIALMLSGNLIVAMAQDYPFAKYILFANTDLKQYADGSVLIEGMTLGFSITILIVYYIIFMAVSGIVFAKRDVT